MPVIWRVKCILNAPTRHRQPHLHCVEIWVILVKNWLSYANLSETAFYCPIQPEYALNHHWKLEYWFIFSKYEEYTTHARAQNFLFIWLFYFRARAPLNKIFILGKTLGRAVTNLHLEERSHHVTVTHLFGIGFGHIQPRRDTLLARNFPLG
jgi:hypothetical protein